MFEEFLAFPSNRSEALAMLYLQKSDLKDSSPEEIAILYLDAYQRINRQFMAAAKNKD